MKIPRSVSIIASFALLAVIAIAYFATHTPPAQVTVPLADATTAASVPVYDHTLAIGDANLQVAFASTDAEQEQGLSDTPSLGADNGMLFIFPTDTTPMFWMKDMQYPLDIVWIDAAKTVVGVSADLDPTTFPTTFSPSAPIRYALEVPSGFAKLHGIAKGTAVSF